MNKIKLNFLFLLFFSIGSLWSNPGEGKYKKTKIIEKSYAVSPDLQFRVNNQYGNVNVSGWDKNTLEVKITIRVTGDDKEAVNQKIKSISVESSGNAREMNFITHIGSSNNSWSLFSLLFGKSTRIGYHIDYEIKVPLTAQVFIKNSYGNIFVDELDGDFILNADYGKLEAGNLNGNANQINIDYFSSSQIDFIKQATIKADYSSLSIDKAYRLKIKADYTKIDIQKVRHLIFNNDYGYIKVREAMLVKGRGDYQTRTFENINSLEFSGDYGAIKIINPKHGFDEILLNCDYTNIKIINEIQTDYRLELMQDYGCFKYDALEFILREEDGQEREIKAYYKNPESTSKINITADYGCIKIYNQP